MPQTFVATAVALTAMVTAGCTLARSAHAGTTSIDVPASNIAPSDTRSNIASRLPAPPLPCDDPPSVFLEAARRALAHGRTGETQEALERAETQLLDRSVDPAWVDRPDTQRAELDIGVARQALAARDHEGAAQAIDDALAAAVPATRPAPPAPPPVLAAVPPPPLSATPPPVYALLPGHWQLTGASYVWIPAETTLRRVQERPFVQGRYAWRDGKWSWAPAPM